VNVAIISDIHANIYAFTAVLKALDSLNVKKVLVCGDIIGYYYWPSQVIDILMSDDRFICILGNHEKNLQEVLHSEEKAFFFQKKYGSGYQMCCQDMSKDQLDWLLSLAESRNVIVDDIQFFMSHGTLGSISGYLYPDAPATQLIANYSDSHFTIFGHTHYPFVHSQDDQYLINPGSVGQPRDIGGLASFTIVNTINRVIQFKRVDFDTRSVIEKAKSIDPHLPYLEGIMKRGVSK